MNLDSILNNIWYNYKRNYDTGYSIFNLVSFFVISNSQHHLKYSLFIILELVIKIY